MIVVTLTLEVQEVGIWNVETLVVFYSMFDYQAGDRYLEYIQAV